MEINSPALFIEINSSEYIFIVGDENENGDFKLIYECKTNPDGIEDNRIADFNLVLNTIKKNIYIIEQKLNFTFKETILILNNFDCSFINITGFKKLNGSQILKENITYILNSLKSNIDKNEKKKTILHIFNSKYTLDKKDIENLPIGLYGDFYSHELSFCLLNNNDYKNINQIFNKCNLKIKKYFLKGFIEGSLLSNNYESINTFFQIVINENKSQILYFENNALKFQQDFNFGINLIISDISKVTSLKIDTIKKIITDVVFSANISKEELIEKKFFENKNYIKIKKQLLFEIAEARIQEFFEMFIIKNINFKSYNKNKEIIFLKISDKSHLKCFKELYHLVFSNYNFTTKLIENFTNEDLMNNANKLIHFGWKKEAIPVTNVKKSIIAKFFEVLFH
jgi:cell division protein FtsA